MPTKERYINLFTDYDFKKIFDTAFDEGWIGGREQRTLEIAKEMLAEGEPVEKVARFTGLAPAIVEKLGGNRQTTV
ncbi:MAG: hypothetical protein WGN25_12450 [Candidatus Electrothrix sp. GW3-4]|uniref:hypothetical protein n=1 Tax=Candidatus Electrothrix sp. GW3-4 TaxID=3126740 RepID=UPI0030D32B06